VSVDFASFLSVARVPPSMVDSDLLAAFDDEVIRAVAAENDVERDLLVDALRDHQRTMRDNPGVENLVYEWRKQFQDPVLDRTPDRYVVAVKASVWEEFGSFLELSDEMLGAVVAVHQEQVLRSLSEGALTSAPELVPLVVTRPASD
jgi:transposase-like protein